MRHAVDTFVAQRESLCNAKAVLFVDDNQTQPGKPNVLLYKRMRTDH